MAYLSSGIGRWLKMLRVSGSTAVISGVGDVFVMKMYYSEIGDYEMNNHVVEYEPDRRIGWEPEAGRGHPDAAPDSSASTRWGHRWSYQLTPDGARQGNRPSPS